MDKTYTLTAKGLARALEQAYWKGVSQTLKHKDDVVLNEHFFQLVAQIDGGGIEMDTTNDDKYLAELIVHCGRKVA